ncbi:MAG: tetratricopeptide (TPR) repeat protein [Urechidicola sp.]|jgi:tetratricopeptide (TPR) repeat protein|tara:strand:+ start:622 stop:1374 length:753 start_codon:yes stop_codon:yes gene_type:complete
MKKLVLILCVFFTSFGFSQTEGELFFQANNLYKNGSYTEAVELYKKIEDLGQESDDLYYNLGNTYYKLNKIAPSIYYYEKALKLNPINEDVITNLAFAKRMKIDAIEVMPKTFLQKFSEKYIYKLHYDTWAWIAVVLSFIGALLFLLYHFSYSSAKKLLYFNTSILSALLLIISVVFAYKSYNHEKNTKHAIIFKQSTEIKNAPTLNSDTTFELHEGTKVLVLDVIDDWKKIKLADGKIGWILADDLREI